MILEKLIGIIIPYSCAAAIIYCVYTGENQGAALLTLTLAGGAAYANIREVSE